MFPYDYIAIFLLLGVMFLIGMSCGSLCQKTEHTAGGVRWCIIASLLIGLIMAYTFYHVIGSMVTR